MFSYYEAVRGGPAGEEPGGAALQSPLYNHFYCRAYQTAVWVHPQQSRPAPALLLPPSKASLGKLRLSRCMRGRNPSIFYERDCAPCLLRATATLWPAERQTSLCTHLIPSKPGKNPSVCRAAASCHELADHPHNPPTIYVQPKQPSNHLNPLKLQLSFVC